jgi:hypothetical protein
MADIAVPRAEVAELLGLPADTDDETLRKAMADLVAAHQAREAEAIAAAAEQRLVAEDRRLVIAACNAGKLPANRIDFWCGALQRDRVGNRAILASLAVGLPPTEKIADDAVVEGVHAKVLGRLGISTQLQRSVAATVAASASPVADAQERQVLDVLGLPTAQVPAPVLLSKATNPEDWTWQQKSDFFQRHILGGRFKEGTQRTPQVSDVYYQPSPNDPYEFTNGEWVEKKPYKELP